MVAVVVLANGLIRLSGRSRVRMGEGMKVELTSYQGGRPSLEGGVGWINTAGPIHLEQLRGKVVLLDFWTYCCINCHHVLADLSYLEDKYKNELVVIGVHTAKFAAEKDTANIRKKVAEYRIKHPVINDANMVLWQRFGVESWPTLAVIDAKGEYKGSVSGEGHRAELDAYIGKLIAQQKALGEINETPIKFFPESEKPHEGNLLYPGKVLADAEGKRLFISDTGNNRIVISDLSGQVKQVVGNGEEGLADGSFDQARFNRPQGMCLVDEKLYVADTENHAIRAIDLKAERVDIVAGTGKQSHEIPRASDPLKTGLNSPWDILRIPGTKTLAIAMAGPHQIWTFDLTGNAISVWAGQGTEGIKDGPLASAWFAQPSGLATDGRSVFVADSEVSGVRQIPIGFGTPMVQTVVGVGLFGFGDVDGRGPTVRLQHCLGVAYADGKLFIADTYNNKIKVCDPKTRVVKTFLGAHTPGLKDDPPQFDEPGGLSAAGETLFVADTNNHAIRAVDLNSKKVTTLKLEGLKAPKPAKQKPSFPNAVALKAPAVQLEPGDHVKLDVEIGLPKGFKVNAEAPMSYVVESPTDPTALAPEAPTDGAQINPPADHFSVSVPLAKAASAGQSLSLKVSVASYACRQGSEGLCTVKSYIWTVPITFSAGGADRVNLTTAVP
jgi:thiol-disulfide isomerase/thioredoxin